MILNMFSIVIGCFFIFPCSFTKLPLHYKCIEIPYPSSALATLILSYSKNVVKIQTRDTFYS